MREEGREESRLLRAVCFFVEYNGVKIIENFLCGKENNPKTCEDGIFIGKQMVVAVDGVTAKGNYLWNGKSSGCFAKDVIIDFLENNSVEKLNAVDLFEKINELFRVYISKAEEEISVIDYPRAAAIAYNDYYHEVWSYGDCQCRINDITYSHEKKVDQINESIRAEVLEEYIQNGYTIEELLKKDPGREAIQENFLKQFSYENEMGELGYAVINGRGIEPQLLKRYAVKPGDEIILATDGYPCLKNNLEESEDHLKRILEMDPLCFREYRSTKGIKAGNVSFDDRAFCRILVEE